MWSPPVPERPAAGWWTELSLNRWVAGVVDEMRIVERAERVERLRQRAHEVDMRLAGVLAADRWARIQRRRDPDWDRWRAVDPAWREYVNGDNELS